MNSTDTDTIAAIATPAGEGGIGIIRISGPGAHTAGKKVFIIEDKSAVIGGTDTERCLLYGQVKDPESGALIDDGFIVFMFGPRTYTGEDVVELQLHGGELVLQKALMAVFKCGVRMAEPGEFTKRAFLSGRIDLTQAEAVMDVIGAGTPRALDSARRRLSGSLRERAEAMSERLTGVIVRLEAEIEFSEDISDDNISAATLPAELSEIKAMVKGLLQTYEEGSALRAGVRVIILGRPNVGKSSLLNRLLGEERAIVTHLPGTTRDVIEEAVNIHGIAVRLMDTAGLRETPDFIESLGVRAARDKIAGADAVLFVFDASQRDFTEDKELLKDLGEKKVILTANKMDMLAGDEQEAREAAIREEFSGLSAIAPIIPPVFISAIDGSGIKALEAALYKSITGRAPGAGLSASLPGEFIATLRQREALLKVLEGVEKAGDAINGGLGTDIIAGELKRAERGLKGLTGEVTADDILNRIFSSFCIGK